MALDTERAPIRILVFSASERTGSLNTKLADLGAKCIEHNGGQVDLASMTEFDAPSVQRRCARNGRLADGSHPSPRAAGAV